MRRYPKKPMTAEEALPGEDTCRVFTRWIIRESVFDGCGLDGGAVQDKAVELGLLIKVPYDPAVHGDIAACDPGEQIFVFSDKLADHS